MNRASWCVTVLALATIARSGHAQAASSSLPSWAIDNVGRLSQGLNIVRGVRLNMSQSEARARLGAPDSVVKGYSEMLDSTVTLYYRDAEVLLDEHGVQSLDCWSQACALPNGVRVGSTLRQVVQALGRGHPGYGPETTHSLFYYPKHHDSWLEIIFDDKQHFVRLSLANDNS